MKNLKTFVFVFSIFFFFSCESEQEIFEEEKEVNVISQQKYQNRASAYIRRGKLQQTQTVGYNAKFFVDNSSEQITSFALLLEGSGGSLETVLKPSGEKDAEGLEIYNWDLDGDGIFEVGEEVKIIATPLNEDGKALGEPQVLIITVEGNNLEARENYIRRAKIKLGEVSSYKATFYVDNISNQFSSFALLLEGSGASLETTVKPNGKKDSKGLSIFEWDFDGDGMFDDSDEAKVTATPINKDGKEIGEAQVLYIKIQKKIKLYSNIIKKPTLSLNKDKKTYSITVPLKRKKLSNDFKNLKVNVTLKATNGDNNGKGNSFGFLEITRGLVVYTDNNVNFSNSSSVIGKKFIAQVSLTNQKGEEMDYAEFRIVGLE